MKTKAAMVYAAKLACHIDRHTSVAARRAVRDAAGLLRSDRTRVVVIPGAYRWPTRYHCSTNRVEVGARWLAVRGLVFAGPALPVRFTNSQCSNKNQNGLKQLTSNRT